MTAPLRPMSLGEILDRSIQIYRRRFLAFVSIGAVATTAMMTVSVADTIWNFRRLLPHVPSKSMWIVTALEWLALSHLHSLIGSVFAPALIRQTRCGVFDNNESVRESLAFGLRRWRRFLGIAALRLALGPLAGEIGSAAVTLGVGMLVYILNPSMKSGALGIVVLLLAFGGVILTQWLCACLSLSIPAATLEDLGGMTALRRSWRVTRERRWAIQFTWIAAYVGFFIVYYGLAFPLQWGWTLAWRALHFHFSRRLYQASFFPIYLAVGAVVGPFFPIASTLIYYDQRIRNEGYDIEQMMDMAGMGAPDAPAAVAVVAIAGESAEAEVQPIATQTESRGSA